MSGPPQLRHDALVYGSDEELVATVVPFVRDGLAQGHAAVVAVTTPNIALLREACGPDSDAVTFISRDEWYRRPASTVAGWKSLLDRAVERGHAQVRIVGEVAFGDNDRHSSWTRYESALNGVFHSAPAWIVCPYDTRTLPTSVLDSARQTHPGVLTATRREHSSLYRTPEEFLSAVGEPLPPVEGEPAIRMKIGDSLAAIRTMVHAAATAGGWLTAERIGDLLLALNEVIANSLRHGRGERALSVWAPGSAVVCEVTDEGSGPADPLVGYRPPVDRADGGMGLWMARQVCDALAIDTVDGVTRVRLAIS